MSSLRGIGFPIGACDDIGFTETPTQLVLRGGCGSGRRRFRGGPHFARRRFHRSDDIHIAGTTTEVAGERAADLLLGRVGVLLEQLIRRDEETWGAEPALQGVVLVKGFLQRRQRAIAGKRFNCFDAGSFHLHRERDAASAGAAVDQHRARPANAVRASDVRARKPQFAAQEVRQQQARLRPAFDLAAVNRHPHEDLCVAHGGPGPSATAC